ncbi:MAG TPA: hypothetical protein VIS07_12060 [Candidatus Binatia bacterium]
MPATVDEARRRANDTRWQPGWRTGHYESFFVRANDPRRPQAFWIRYTIFSPEGRPEDARGELWAVVFDGKRGIHTAAKTEVPIAQCEFRNDRLGAYVADARLEPGRVVGAAASGGHTIAWDLSFTGDAEPLLALPPALYDAKLPRAKTLVPLPLATFRGTLTVDGKAYPVFDWVGSQNHNWGSRHTDHYAWGQVAGFDDAPESFLEVATARLKLGPVWTPFMTLLVLRHEGREIALNSLLRSVRARGRFTYFDWTFRSEDAAYAVEGRISAPRAAFVGLRYDNPPGGVKHCLNSKLASCELTLVDKRAGGAPVTLATRHRAAFEILTDDRAHGVPIVA